MARTHRTPRAFTLIELLFVVGMIALLIAILLPTLSRIRTRALQSKMAAERAAPAAAAVADGRPARAGGEQDLFVPPRLPPARVRAFEADVTLTPRLAAGTDQPESIYELRFDGRLRADTGPAAARAANPAATDAEIRLPLPPQIISVGDLIVTVDGQRRGTVALAGDELVWRGPLPAAPADGGGDAAAAADVAVAFTAVGRGVYALATPPTGGEPLERFRIALTAAGSDVRMLALSLQPTAVARGAGATTYTWDYRRLLFGRPVLLDVLGIAPVDRLGELSWLGPLSVVAFGLLVGLIAKAYDVGRFDRWMLLLTVGTFTAAYPLMYFAQQFTGLNVAMTGAAGAVLAIIAWRAVSIMGWRLGLGGVVLPAAAVYAIALTAAVRPNLQGILLTVLGIGFFVVAMLLLPRLADRDEDAGASPAMPLPA